MGNLVCPCGLAVHKGTKHLHRPHCSLDTRSQEDRIAQAIGDPGSILARRIPEDGRQPYESVTRWATRAVLAVLHSETTLVRGLMFLDDAAGGDRVAGTPRVGRELPLRCQTRAANADGVTFRCAESAGHEAWNRRCNFVAETIARADMEPIPDQGASVTNE